MKQRIGTLDEFINEQYLNDDNINESRIVDKDWKRMLDLVLSNNPGESVAKKITKKDKAIARFVAGSKLLRKDLKYSDTLNQYMGLFASFGNKALELGATPEEIEELFTTTIVPEKYFEEITKSKGKKLDNRFVGQITKVVLKNGFDIEYLPHNGYAITGDGKEAMERSGIKWTIGYKTEIDLGDRKVKFYFDAITDEGDGPTKYVLEESSDKIFKSLLYKIFGVQQFIKTLDKILSEEVVENSNKIKERKKSIDDIEKVIYTQPVFSGKPFKNKFYSLEIYYKDGTEEKFKDPKKAAKAFYFDVKDIMDPIRFEKELNKNFPDIEFDFIEFDVD